MVQVQSSKKALSVKEIREPIDLNQEEFAIAAGITKGHLANIENYSRNFTLDSAVKIADAINNILDRAREIGDLERSVDLKVKKLGKYWRKESSEAEELLGGENIKIKLLPEMLIASHAANTYAIKLQEISYELLINIEMNNQKLQYLKRHGKKFKNNYLEKLNEEFKYSPAEIICNFLADPYYKQALRGVIEEFRENISRVDGYFLSKTIKSKAQLLNR